MKKAIVLSKAEMRNVMGGVLCTDGNCVDPARPCDASNGTIWTTECRVNNAFVPPSYYYNVLTWDAGSPCGGSCGNVGGDCVIYYQCNDQSGAA